MSEGSMYHHGEIVDAIALMCTGAVRLAVDAAQTATLRVGSNRLFAAGDEVRVFDGHGATAEGTVTSTVGLDQVLLEPAVAGPFLVADGACVRRVSGYAPRLEWVGKWVPKIGAQPTATRYPCALVRPTALHQPRGEGTSRALMQDYLTSVYYVREQAQGENEEAGLLQQVGLLFDLLMADPYLGGTSWYSQVVEVDCAKEDERWASHLRVARLDMISLRSELSTRG